MLVVLAGLVLAFPFATASSTTWGVPHTDAGTNLAMQLNESDPLWSLLRATGTTNAQWARLLTSDGDGNHLTDFLDLASTLAQAHGLSRASAELLVRGTPDALAAIQSTHPDAVPVRGVGLFLTARLNQAHSLAIPGVSMVVWEPRAYATGVTNPAGGSPSTMDQIVQHQGDQAWTAGYTGSGVKIAILDTGVDASHDALAGGKVTAFKDCIGTSTTAYDDHGHGSHVASIAAGNDGTDFRGLAYQASVVGVKVLDSAGSGSLTSFQCGVDYVTTGSSSSGPTADLASMSAGLGVPPLGLTTLNGGEFDLFGWDTVAEEIPDAGLPFTVAAGNWIGTVVEFIGLGPSVPEGVNGVNQVSSPGFASGVVTVGAVDSTQSPATFSAVGPGKLLHQKPDVSAMGVLTWGAAKGTTHDYIQLSGTSMATPLAAGAIAILMDKTSGLSHGTYEDALRNGASQACILGNDATSCFLGLTYSPSPNDIDGYGIVRVKDSLALV